MNVTQLKIEVEDLEDAVVRHLCRFLDDGSDSGVILTNLFAKAFGVEESLAIPTWQELVEYLREREDNMLCCAALYGLLSACVACFAEDDLDA